MFRAFKAFCASSFLFLEMWAWPPAQRNDLGFKCEKPHSLRPWKGHCIQEQEAKSPSVPRWHVTHPSDHFARSRLVMPLLPPTATSTFTPSLRPVGGQQWSPPRWDPECRQKQEVIMWGRICPFVLLLSSAVSVRMAVLWPLNYPEGLCFHVFAWLSDTKRNSLL